LGFLAEYLDVFASGAWVAVKTKR